MFEIHFFSMRKFSNSYYTSDTRLRPLKFSIQVTAAQITILRGNASSSPIHCCDATKSPSLISCELYTSPLHCLCTPYAIGAPSSAPLCSEHTNQMQWTAVVGDVTSPTSDTMCHSCAPILQVVPLGQISFLTQNIMYCLVKLFS